MLIRPRHVGGDSVYFHACYLLGKKFIKRIDHPRLEPGIYELRDVVSRKKQLLPYLTHCLREKEKGVKG